MPNWSENRVSVTHENPAMVAKFVAACNEGGLFATFAPMPEELVNTVSPSPAPNTALIEKYGVDNWYDWSVKNWGTKWDAADGEMTLVDGGKRGVGVFLTAWSPPIEFFNAATDLGFSFDVVYVEVGMSFAGHYYDGYDSCFNFDFGNADWREDIEDEAVLKVLEELYNPDDYGVEIDNE